MYARALAVFEARVMKTAFVVIPEGDLFYIMQVCPDALISASGSCAYALYCDCLHSDDGPLWQFRGYFQRRFEAERRAAKLQAQFELDCGRKAAVLDRLEARERAAMAGGRLSDGLGPDDVPY